MNPEENGKFSIKYYNFFSVAIFSLIVERAYCGYATVSIHTAAEDAWKYCFFSILSVTIKNESEVHQISLMS